MALPLPSVPSTVYAPGSEVESADLNDYQTFMAAAKAYLEAGDFEGPSTFDDTMEVTGLITALAGLTAAANQDVTVSGTGQFKHGSRSKVFPAAGGIQDPTEGNQFAYTSSTGSMDATGVGALSIPIHLDAGKRILSMTFHLYAGDTSTRTVQLFRNNAYGTRNSEASESDATGGTITITISGINYTVLATESLWAHFGAQHADDRCQYVKVEYDEP